MTDSAPARLASAHLEDLAIVALSARCGILTAHPVLDDDRRARLRSRIKHISRYDWPSSLKDDRYLRRGYTLRQCCRLIVVLQLIDAHIPPGLAVPIASANERPLLRIMANRMSATDQATDDPEDMIAVVMLGELSGLVAGESWSAAQPQRLRFVSRSRLPHLWSDDGGLNLAGQRLPLDVGHAAATTWRWMQDRRLMLQDALPALIADLDADDGPAFDPGVTQILRR